MGSLDPDRFLAAFVRGSKTTVDLAGDWDFWAVIGESVVVLRERSASHRSGRHGLVCRIDVGPRLLSEIAARVGARSSRK
jgi:hypothetical protein